MAFKRKNGELATELKDLDVDRVDGVDKPATGRPFALYKSADEFHETDAAHLAAVLKRLMPSVEQVYANLILKACDDCILKCEGADGKIVGYLVKGIMTSPQPLDACVVRIERIIRAEIAKGKRFFMEGYKTPDVPSGGGAPQRGQPAVRDGENRAPNWPDATSSTAGGAGIMDSNMDHL